MCLLSGIIRLIFKIVKVRQFIRFYKIRVSMRLLYGEIVLMLTRSRRNRLLKNILNFMDKMLTLLLKVIINRKKMVKLSLCGL